MLTKGKIERSTDTIDDGILGLPLKGVKATAFPLGVKLISAFESGVKPGEAKKKTGVRFHISDDRTGIVGESLGIDCGGNGEAI